MRLFRQIMVGASLALLLPALAAEAYDEKEPILCAIRDVSDCGADYPCVKATPESVALPDFFEIDLASNKITSVGWAAPAVSPIENIERLHGRLILQGGDASGDNPRGGVGWTMTVDEDDGKLIIAGVGDGFALVIFGSCVQR